MRTYGFESRADAITRGPDGRLYFAEPHVERMTMRNFLAKLTSERLYRRLGLLY